MDGFDFLHPDYTAVLKQRGLALQKIRSRIADLREAGETKAAALVVPSLKLYYREHPWQFISDWGMTYDPRNVEIGEPAVIPFILFPRQIEWCQWVVAKWKAREPGLTEKSRDMGVSWLSVSLAATLALHYENLGVGFGSNLARNVDQLGNNKSLFAKARTFLSNLPVEFRGGFDLKRHAPEMRITIPETGSTLMGEGGDEIGRGDRQSIYFVDEHAKIEHPQLIEAALSQTTNCQMDISTPFGRANVFAEKRFSGRVGVFTFHWTQDPRKDQAWYEKQKRELDPVILAQEVDLDYSASVEGVLIPAAWVVAAIDAHVRLGIDISGDKHGAMDVADEGRDKNAFAGRRGVLLEQCEEWSGIGSDIFRSVQHVFWLCDEHGYETFTYDADGVGADVRGAARVINETRPPGRVITARMFHGAGAVLRPEQKEPQSGRTNKDMFANRKAQEWWELRRRFQRTYRAIQHLNDPSLESPVAAHDELISISGKLPNVQKLISELSQPTWDRTGTGKILINKTPEGAKSPNLADAVMIAYSGSAFAPVKIRPDALARARMRRRR